MNDIVKLFVSTYQDLIFSAVLQLRSAGLTFLTVNMVNGGLLLIMLAVAYKMFEMAKKAVIYFIILAIVMLPFILLIISSFFSGGATLNGLAP